MVDSAFQGKPRHLAAAHLRIDHDGFQPVAFADAKLRGDDPHLAGEAPPVEEPLHLGAGQIEQHAVVGLDFADETVGEPLPPEVETCLLLLARQDGVAFEPVGADGIQRTEQPVEKRSDVQMLLGVFEVVVGETPRVEPLEDDSRVGRQGREAFGVVERGVTASVLGGDRAVYAQDSGQVVGRERCQGCGCGIGFLLEAGFGGAGRADRGVIRHRLGAGEQDLHGGPEFAVRNRTAAQATEQGIPSASTRAAMRCSSSRETFSSVGQGVSRSSE